MLEIFLFNLCILQAGPINKNLIQDYPSYDKMFSSLLNNKIQFWNVGVYNIYENIFPENLTSYNAFIITGSAYGVYENHSWIQELFEVIKKNCSSLNSLAWNLLWTSSYCSSFRWTCDKIIKRLGNWHKRNNNKKI